MGQLRWSQCAPRALTLGVIATAMALSADWSPGARAQGPQFDPGAPPGAAGGMSAVGQPLGAANFPDFETPQSTPISGRAGLGGSHAPISGLSTPGAPVFRTSGAQETITSAQPLSVPSYGELDLPAGEVDYGPTSGMSIDAAIEIR
jgi:hypothetical protein